LCGLFQQAHAGALQGGEMPRTRHDAKASTDAGGDSSHRKEAPERRRKQGVACEARYAQKRCRCASVPEAWTRTSTDAMQHCSPHRRRAGQRDVKNVKSPRRSARCVHRAPEQRKHAARSMRRRYRQRHALYACATRRSDQRDSVMRRILPRVSMVKTMVLPSRK